MKENMSFTEPKILEVEDLTMQLLEANKKIQQDEEERTRMMSDIAHDLRAPVNALRSSIDYLIAMRDKDIFDMEEFDKVLGIMDKRTKGLQNLIQDMYFLLTLEQQKESIYNFEVIELGAFLEEYFYNFSLRYDKKRVCILDMPVDLNVCVNIDVEKMVRVLDNLTSNAVKYSSENDKITIGAYKNKNGVTFFVADTGIGIAPENLNRIFEHTYQVSKARTPDADSGSGLGLAIVKTIITQHKGNIHCESRLLEGSVFYVDLPESD